MITMELRTRKTNKTTMFEAKCNCFVFKKILITRRKTFTHPFLVLQKKKEKYEVLP